MAHLEMLREIVLYGALLVLYGALIMESMTTPKGKVYQSSLKFAQRLRELRKKNKLTQEKAAELADIGMRYYKQLESRNPNSVTLETLHKLAKAFKTTPSKLIKFD